MAIQTVDYRIIQGGTMADLEIRVKKFLDAGWDISGGVSVTGQPGHIQLFYQAMIQTRSI